MLFNQFLHKKIFFSYKSFRIKQSCNFVKKKKRKHNQRFYRSHIYTTHGSSFLFTLIADKCWHVWFDRCVAATLSTEISWIGCTKFRICQSDVYKTQFSFLIINLKTQNTLIVSICGQRGPRSERATKNQCPLFFGVSAVSWRILASGVL